MGQRGSRAPPDERQGGSQPPPDERQGGSQPPPDTGQRESYHPLEEMLYVLSDPPDMGHMWIRASLDRVRFERRRRRRQLELEHLAAFEERLWGARPSPPALNQLPYELLALILSWVPGRDLLTRCRPVCRRWRDLIDGPTVWRLQGERRPGSRATLEATRYWVQPRWSRICLLEPFGRNLLRNPCGQDQFSHWQVQHGGDGWNVEENLCPVEGAPAQTCFVSSFCWCVKSQLVDLLEEGLWEELLDTYQPEIYISDWWGARGGCGCEYSICVKLLAANRSTVIAVFQAGPHRLPRSSDSQYHQVSYRFRQYGRGVRYVHFLHKGIDGCFWAGHYGARITNSTVMVKLNGEPGAGPHESLTRVLSAS